MAPESLIAKTARGAKVLARLRAVYPEPHRFLDGKDPFQLVCATILSAQCTDAQVNRVTPALFERWPTPERLASAPRRELERVIHSTGFFHNKAQNLLGMAKAVVAEHGGKVPDTMEGLLTLPGVGRKTANVVLTQGFGKTEGVCVDTHVARLSQRLGFSAHADPVRIERDLMRAFPRDTWDELTYYLIAHGRAVCTARAPACAACAVNASCPKRGVRSKPA